MASETDRTQPGSKNDWRITYDTGSQKWTDDFPGDGVGPNSGRLLKDTLKEPSVQRGLSAISTAIKKDKRLDEPVKGLVRDVGSEKGKIVLNAVYKGVKDAEGDEKMLKGWDKARKMVASSRSRKIRHRGSISKCGSDPDTRSGRRRC